MAVSESYRAFVLEELNRVRPVTARAMFGGVGLYAADVFFALIAQDRLYFKVDDTTRGEFERRGMEPFRPFGEDSAMGYYELPADILETFEPLRAWTEQAVAVALRARDARGRKPAKRPAAARASTRRSRSRRPDPPPAT